MRPKIFKNTLYDIIVYLAVILCLLALFFVGGCGLSQPDKKGNAIIDRDITVINERNPSPEATRIKSVVQAKLKAHGHPDDPVLPVSAPTEAKDKEAAQVSKDIEEHAGLLGGLFGGLLGTILMWGTSLAGVGFLAWKGRWGLAAMRIIKIMTEGVQRGRQEKWDVEELKEYIEAETKGTWMTAFLDKYVGKAKRKLNGKAPTEES